MPSYQFIHNYFANLNPLAEKIACDIDEAKTAYGHIWLKLSEAEQENILNDTLIKPEIEIKYFKESLKKDLDIPSKENIYLKETAAKPGKNGSKLAFDRQTLDTFIHQNFGLKLMHDDSLGDYRDEHSFPFSFRTRSQMNLAERLVTKTYFLKNDNVDDYSETLLVELNAKDEEILQPQKASSSTAQLSSISEFTNLNDNNYEETQKLVEDEENGELSSLEVEIPKGFDFLSNW